MEREDQNLPVMQTLLDDDVDDPVEIVVVVVVAIVVPIIKWLALVAALP